MLLWWLLVFTVCIKGQIPYSTQVHIALNPQNKISISWVTDAPYNNKNNNPIVYLSSINPKYLQNFTLNSTQIIGYTECNVNLSRYYHHVITPSLNKSFSGIQYWYKPGNNASIYTFIARNNVTNESTKFLVYGDLGVTNSENTVKLIKNLTNSLNSSTPSKSIDFIAHIGDISYADDRDLFDDNPEYIPIYDEWGKMMEPIFSTTPYMVGPGNHEQTCHSWSDFECKPDLKNFTMYRQYFRMPSIYYNESGGGPFNMWYSFNYKNIHILQIDTETDYPGSPDQADYHNDIINPECGPFGDQMEFIQRDLLDAYNNKNISWIIVLGHRPWYSSEWVVDTDWPPQTEIFSRRAFEPLFYKYNVDIYIAGHVHGYERSYPVYDEKVTTNNYSNPLSTIYFVSGAAGSIEGHSSTVPLNEIRNYTAVYDHKHFGVGQINVINDTHLIWQFIESENQTVIDTVTISKGHWT